MYKGWKKKEDVHEIAVINILIHDGVVVEKKKEYSDLKRKQKTHQEITPCCGVSPLLLVCLCTATSCFTSRRHVEYMPVDIASGVELYSAFSTIYHPGD
jgi:hypothetical protein